MLAHEDYEQDARWYVVHTYSGYENKVKANLDKIVENRNLHDKILGIIVPMEEQIEIKEGKRKTSLKKVFPGYVLVKMYMTDDTWYIVRNVRGVTGFVGSGAKPIPLSDREIINMGIEELDIVIDFEVGDNVKVMSGPLQDFIGIIEEINMEKRKVRVLVSMFGRETPAELEFTQIQKI